MKSDNQTPNYDETQGAAWDARQKYTTEIVYRLHLFLNASKDQLKLKLECLSDLFFSAVGFIEKHELIQAELRKIEKLLYPPKTTNPNTFGEMRAKAAELIDEVYIKVFMAIKKKDLLVPEKEFTDEVTEFENLL